MSFDGEKILYLEDTDFDEETLLYNGVPLTKGKFFIMIQADYCGYCKTAKPAFIEASRRAGGLHLGGIIFATIHSDSKNDSERNLGKQIGRSLGISGIPVFLLFDAEKKKFTKYDGNRTTEAMLEFLGSV
jgi:thiol-disulfide isomerase/thioredoxin